MNPNRVDLDTSTVNTLVSPAQTSVIIQDQIEWSQEFRIESKQDSEINWVLGAFYSDSETDGDATRTFGVTEQTVYNRESSNIAIFTSLAKDFTQNDILSLGLRYDNYERKWIARKMALILLHHQCLILTIFLIQMTSIPFLPQSIGREKSGRVNW